MKRLATPFLLLLLCLGAGPAFGAPTARFTVTRASGPAPLAVLFDASTTTDPATGRPFHDLKYEWDFDDPDSGEWAVAPSGNASRNYGLGPVTGHVFDPAAGAYEGGVARFTVTLTVTNASGQRHTAVQVITVQDPNGFYSGSDTTCVSSSGNFSGCPSGARRVTSASFDGSLDNAAGSRTLYRRGDTFSGTVSLANASSRSSQIGAFGSGAAPVVRSILVGGGTALAVDNGWTVWGLHFVGDGGTATARPAGDAVRDVTLYELQAQGFDQCATWSSPSAPSIPSEIYVVDFTCTDSRGRGSAYFGRNVRSLFLGLHIDASQAGSSEFVWRSVHLDTVAIQHSYFTGTTNGRSSLHFRACDVGSQGCTGPQQRLVFSDNHVHQTDGSSEFFRICGQQECSQDDTQNQTQDFLIEGNYWSSDYTLPGSLADYVQRWGQVQGRDVSIRNNVVNLDRAPSRPMPRMRLVVLNEDPGISYDRIEVLHNTFYFGSGWQAPIVLCSGASGQDKKCQGNLVVAPGSDVERTEAQGSWITGGNLMDGATGAGRFSGNPFVVASPDSMDDFRLSGSGVTGTSPVDTAGTSGVLLDAFQNCRTSPFDVGAHERGATPCPATPGGAGPPPLQPPAAPILLP